MRRGGIPLTPRGSGESKGGTQVAAIAKSRCRVHRIPLPLNSTSDVDRTTRQAAARRVLIVAFAGCLPKGTIFASGRR